MLILLALFYVYLSTHGVVYTLPLEQQTSEFTPQGSDVSERTIWSIAWNCLVTISLCTWTAGHPNLAGQQTRKWTALYRRMRLVIDELFVPELVIIWAMQQWFVARKLSEKLKDRGWTITHGYFVSMGGFVLEDGRPLSPEELIFLLENEYIKFPEITEDEINDKSKGDGVSKVLTLLQTIWFIAQCIARSAQGLEITALELLTCAFAATNTMTYIFWWHKPLHIQCAVQVKLNRKISEEDMRRCQLIVTYPEVTNDLGFYTGSEKEMLVESEKQGKGGEPLVDDRGSRQDSPHDSPTTGQEDATENTTTGQPVVNVELEPVTNDVVDVLENKPEDAVKPGEPSSVEAEPALKKDGVLEDGGPPPVEAVELPMSEMLGVPKQSAAVETVVDGQVACAEASRTGSALEREVSQIEVIEGQTEKEVEDGALRSIGDEKEDVGPGYAVRPTQPSSIEAGPQVAENLDSAPGGEADSAAEAERTLNVEGEREDVVKSETQGLYGTTGVNRDQEDAVIAGEADSGPEDVGTPDAVVEGEGEEVAREEGHDAHESEEPKDGKPESIEEETRSRKAQDAIDDKRYRYRTTISWPIFMFETARISLVEEWRMRVEEKRVGREYAGNLGPKQLLVSLLLGGLTSFTFALIHCAGWNFVFPTNAEQMSWRACCCMIMGVPWLLAGIYAFTTALWRHLHPFRNMFRLLAMSTRYVYVLARLTMFAQVFFALRALPPLMLQELSWTSFIPHLR